jgi:hypothetical protein
VRLLNISCGTKIAGSLTSGSPTFPSIASEHRPARICFVDPQLGMYAPNRELPKHRNVRPIHARVSMYSLDGDEILSSDVSLSRRGLLGKAGAALFAVVSTAKSARAMDWIPEAPKEGSCAGTDAVCVTCVDVMRETNGCHSLGSTLHLLAAKLLKHDALSRLHRSH